MRALLADPRLARRVGEAGRVTAASRFSIHRFVRDWDRLLRDACGPVGRVAPGWAGASPARAGAAVAHAGSGTGQEAVLSVPETG
jgi:hypothetical protein